MLFRRAQQDIPIHAGDADAADTVVQVFAAPHGDGTIIGRVTGPAAGAISLLKEHLIPFAHAAVQIVPVQLLRHTAARLARSSFTLFATCSILAAGVPVRME